MIANRAETKVLAGIEINRVTNAPKAVMTLREYGIKPRVLYRQMTLNGILVPPANAGA